MPIDSRESGMSSGVLIGGNVISCSLSHGARNMFFPSVVCTVIKYFFSRAIKSSKGFSVGGTSMLPRYRISLYSVRSTDFLGIGAVLRVASLYVVVAAGFASSSSSESASVGT